MTIAGWVTLTVQQTVWERMSAKRAGVVQRLRDKRTDHPG
jgi:hypothetical protein